MSRSASVLGALIAVLSACAPPVPEDARQHRNALIGGTDSDADPAVVLLVVHRPDKADELCTGTVIGRRTILTAAHCVALQSVGKDATFTLFLGPDYRDAAARSQADLTRAVERTAIDPEFEADLLQRGHDIAVVLAKEPLGIAPINLLRQPLSTATSALRIVGYGLSSTLDDSGSTAGRRRHAQIPVQGVRGTFVDVGSAERVPCHGDSGGPGLLQPEGEVRERLVGVVSYTSRACAGEAVVTALSAYLPLIDGWLATEGATSMQDGAGGCTMAPGKRAPGLAGAPWYVLLFGIGLLIRSGSARGGDYRGSVQVETNTQIALCGSTESEKTSFPSLWVPRMLRVQSQLAQMARGGLLQHAVATEAGTAIEHTSRDRAVRKTAASRDPLPAETASRQTGTAYPAPPPLHSTGAERHPYPGGLPRRPTQVAYPGGLPRWPTQVERSEHSA